MYLYKCKILGYKELVFNPFDDYCWFWWFILFGRFPCGIWGWFSLFRSSLGALTLFGSTYQNLFVGLLYEWAHFSSKTSNFLYPRNPLGENERDMNIKSGLVSWWCPWEAPSKLIFWNPNPLFYGFMQVFSNLFIMCMRSFWNKIVDLCGLWILIRSSMDRGRAQAVPLGTAKGRQRRLERYFEEFCEDSHSDPSRQPRSEVLPQEDKPQSSPPSI